MRAVLCRETGGPEVLEVREVPEPRPGRDEILVRNYACGLNRADILQRRGLYPPPPGVSEILGLEFAGEVAAWGEGVRGFERGDRVCGIVAGGACADFVTIDHRAAIPIPDTLSYEAAAALPEACITAYENLFHLGGLRQGDWAIVHAGASGVGSAAIQLARAAGVQVLATTSSPEKQETCRKLGAARVVDYRAEDFAAAALEATAGRGVDAILDLVGAKHWERNLRSLRDGGRLLVVGLVGGSRVEADLGLILRRRLQIIGNALRSRSLEDKAAMARRFRDHVLPLVERGAVRAVIDSVLVLEDVRAAHERMERNANSGKIILRL